MAQFDVLGRVDANEGLTQQELARALLVTKGNVCQLLDRMQARGLIERRPARSGRGNHLYLTDKGRQLHRLAVPAQEDLIAGRLGVLTPAEQDQLLALLRKLDRTLAAEEEDGPDVAVRHKGVPPRYDGCPRRPPDAGILP